jgi:hypothetical protein
VTPPAVAGAALRQSLIARGVLVPVERVEARPPPWVSEPATLRLGNLRALSFPLFPIPPEREEP